MFQVCPPICTSTHLYLQLPRRCRPPAAPPWRALQLEQQHRFGGLLALPALLLLLHLLLLRSLLLLMLLLQMQPVLLLHHALLQRSTRLDWLLLWLLWLLWLLLWLLLPML